MRHKEAAEQSEEQASSLFKTLLSSFSMVAVLCCLSVGALTYYLRANGIRDQQYRLLETVRDEKIRNITSWFEERRGDLRVMASRENFVDFISGVGKVPAEEIRSALLAIRNAYNYETIYLTDARGIVLVSTESKPHSPGAQPERQKQLLKAVSSGGIVVSDIFISTLYHKPMLVISSPVRSQKTAKIIGTVGVETDPANWLYPQINYSASLGKTGEVVLVNAHGLVQNPLKYHDDVIAKLTINAEPARRGARGEIGRIAIDDYRPVPVMAAYGHLEEFDWGIVVKQDMSEINAPVKAMALNILEVSVGVLLLVLLFGFWVAARISKPARNIAAIAAQAGKDNLGIRVSPEGPTEIRQIAHNINMMLDEIASQNRVNTAVASIAQAAGRRNKTTELLKDVLPMLMHITRSQLGVVYLAAGSDTASKNLYLTLSHGINPDTISARITLRPPDNLLTEAMLAEPVTILNDIPTANELIIHTPAGDTAPRAIIRITLALGEQIVGVIGMSSLYDYDETSREIARGISTNLAQAIQICNTLQLSEEMGQELSEKNTELEATAKELAATTTEQKSMISELEVQRQQVAQADKLKSEFLSNMSHELRTPLNSVLTLSQLMLANGIGEANGKDKENIEIIERNARHLLHLINDILDLSKIEAGKMEIYVSSFPVAEPVREVVSAIRPLAEQKGLAVLLEMDESISMNSDEDKIRQILFNLFANANKFTDSGQISLSVSTESAEKDYVKFVIADTGCGIAPDELPQIFDEFKQADGSTTRRYGGTGLGLAICQHLVALLGGSIDVESHEDRGSTFTLMLPQRINKTAEEADFSYDIPNAGSTWNSSAKPPHVLVVEDEEIAASQVATLLQNQGYTVDVAVDGKQALAVVGRQIPDAILLDLMLPVLDGFAVLNELRSTPATRLLPVLVLTAKDLTASERALLDDNNVFQLIQKGKINRQQLIEAIQNLLGRGSTRGDHPADMIRPKVKRTDRPPCVLIVEDNPDNMKVIKDILEGMDLNILEAADGQQALERIITERPDIVLLDINLPLLSGLDVTKAVRKNKNAKDTVIIAVTARAMAGDREEILAAGCDGYVSKPIDSGLLRSTILAWIEDENADGDLP